MQTRFLLPHISLFVTHVERVTLQALPPLEVPQTPSDTMMEHCTAVLPIGPQHSSFSGVCRQASSSDSCDACPYCNDSCGDAACTSCSMKIPIQPLSRRRLQYFSPCQVRRHCTTESLWVTAGDSVYDVTDYLKYHPGGMQSLLKKAGQDVTEDVEFHSEKAVRLIRKMMIGKLRPCPCEPKQWWKIW